MITLLNIIRIIYSHIIIYKYKYIKLNSIIIENIIETHNTSILSNYEICMWIKYLKESDRCKNWTKCEMYREIIYHKKLYKHNLFTSHTNYADFERVKTFKTYLYRIIGNCIY